MGTIGIGVIGCGYWGANYLRVFNEINETRVVMACDQRVERLQELEKRFPGIELTADCDELLSNNQVDAIVVCTEAASHHQVVGECLAAGRHVLVEKPMTTRVDEARDLIERANQSGVMLMVGHTFLYNAGIRKVKGYINEDEAGRIYYMYAQRTNLGPIRRDVNALWDLAPHDISIFNYLLDCVPEWVSAVGARVLRNGREDVGFISLGYPNGVVGHIHVSWADPHKVREVVVVGSNRRIVFDDCNAQERVRVFEKGVKSVDSPTSFGEYQLMMDDGDIIIPKVEASEPLKNQCKHFVDSVLHGTTPLTDGQNGLDVVRIMAATDRSMELKGVPVQVA